MKNPSQQLPSVQSLMMCYTCYEVGCVERAQIAAGSAQNEHAARSGTHVLHDQLAEDCLQCSSKTHESPAALDVL